MSAWIFSWCFSLCTFLHSPRNSMRTLIHTNTRGHKSQLTKARSINAFPEPVHFPQTWHLMAGYLAKCDKYLILHDIKNPNFNWVSQPILEVNGLLLTTLRSNTNTADPGCNPVLFPMQPGIGFRPPETFSRRSSW